MWTLLGLLCNVACNLLDTLALWFLLLVVNALMKPSYSGWLVVVMVKIAMVYWLCVPCSTPRVTVASAVVPTSLAPGVR